MKTSRTPIVADGAERLRQAKDRPQRRRQIADEVRRAQESRKVGATLWQRWQIEWEIRREIRRRLDAEFPPAALHLVSVGRS